MMFLDTGILIEILINERNSERFKEIFDKIESKNRFISIISIGEITDVLIRCGISPEEYIEKIKQMGKIVGINEKRCVEGAKIKNQRRKERFDKFSLIDGFILATARDLDEILITTDWDFDGFKNVMIL